jgi:hypothetical protein
MTEASNKAYGTSEAVRSAVFPYVHLFGNVAERTADGKVKERLVAEIKISDIDYIHFYLRTSSGLSGNSYTLYLLAKHVIDGLECLEAKKYMMHYDDNFNGLTAFRCDDSIVTVDSVRFSTFYIFANVDDVKDIKFGVKVNQALLNKHYKNATRLPCVNNAYSSAEQTNEGTMLINDVYIIDELYKELVFVKNGHFVYATKIFNVKNMIIP